MIGEALVIHAPAAREAELTAEARELAADADAYRLLAHVALAEVARLTGLVARLTSSLRATRRELSRYTGSHVGRAA